MFRSKNLRGKESQFVAASFNPCSRGCFARSVSTVRIRDICLFQSLFSWMFRSKFACNSVQALNSVSILVLVDVSLEDPNYQLIRHRAMFQSLFSWMFRSKPSRYAPRSSGSFNPCSRGCFARRTKWILPCFLYPVSILVLVDVSLEACTESEPVAESGFNPCSRGCFARSPVY